MHAFLSTTPLSLTPPSHRLNDMYLHAFAHLQSSPWRVQEASLQPVSSSGQEDDHHPALPSLALPEGMVAGHSLAPVPGQHAVLARARAVPQDGSGALEGQQGQGARLGVRGRGGNAVCFAACLPHPS